MKAEDLQSLEPGTLLTIIHSYRIRPTEDWTGLSRLIWGFDPDTFQPTPTPLKVGETVLFLKAIKEPASVFALVLYGKQKYMIGNENLEIAKEK